MLTGFLDPLLYVVLAAFVLGGLVLFGMAVLYLRSYPRLDQDTVLWLDRILIDLIRQNASAQQREYYWSRVSEATGSVAADALAKREAFWALLIQSAVSLVVVVFIAVLLLLKIVSAEAGLPILAAFGGAVIGQGVSTGRAAIRGPTNTPAPPRTE
jgi:hypothetical protein